MEITISQNCFLILHIWYFYIHLICAIFTHPIIAPKLHPSKKYLNSSSARMCEFKVKQIQCRHLIPTLNAWAAWA